MLRCVIRLVVSLMLCLGLTAHAEAACAWVLWQQQRTWWERAPATDVWSIVEIFETKADCESVRGKSGDENSWSDERTKTFTATRQLCYPDTIDPRGPKDRGR
jgi:hypothetical protein